MSREDVELLVSIVSSLIIFGGLVYAGMQLKLTRLIQQENHDWNRRQSAQQALYNYSNFVSGTELLNKEFGFASSTEPLQLQVIESAFETNPELRIICHKLLNFNETLAIGVIHGLYDEDIIKSAWRGNMIRSFNVFSNYIEKYRTIGNRKNAFNEQEMMINRWRNEETNKEFRKPIAN